MRHRAAVLVCWLAPLPLLLHGAYHVGARLKSIIPSRPGADSSVVAERLAREFPRQAQFVAELSFHDPRWTADDGPFRDSVAAMHAAARGLPCVKLLTSWPELPLRGSFVSPDAHTQISLVEIEAAANDHAAAERCVIELRRAAARARPTMPLPDLEVLVTGAPAVDHDIGLRVRRDGLRAELVVLAVSLVLLVWMFRSVTAAFLPLVTAGLAVAACMTVVWAVAAHVRLSVYVSTVSTMMGLALGLDYALLYVNRFREELAGGRGPGEALEVTAATAGRAVLGSGGGSWWPASPGC